MATVPKGKPRVLLLDIDGTVIGRIAAAVCEHTILSMSGQGGQGDQGNQGPLVVSMSSRRAAERAMRNSLVCRLRHGIVRPGFDDFCRRVGAPGENVQLFVYTAAEDRWAAFIVSCIEAAVGVKFNRPLFTRRDCVSVPSAADPNVVTLRKSLKRVLPVVLSRLRRNGYDRTVLPDVRALRACTALIDNTPDVGHEPDDTQRIVHCPTYQYSYNYDVLGRVDVDFLHRRFPSLLPLLQRYDMFPSSSSPSSTAFRTATATATDAPTPAPKLRYQRFCQLYFARLARTLSDTNTPNTLALRDTFWDKMYRAMSRDDHLDIVAINRRIQGDDRAPSSGSSGGGTGGTGGTGHHSSNRNRHRHRVKPPGHTSRQT